MLNASCNSAKLANDLQGCNTLQILPREKLVKKKGDTNIHDNAIILQTITVLFGVYHIAIALTRSMEVKSGFNCSKNCANVLSWIMDATIHLKKEIVIKKAKKDGGG